PPPPPHPGPPPAGVAARRQGGLLRRPGRRRCHQLDGVELLVRLPQELCEESDAERVAHADLEPVECDGPVFAVAAKAPAVVSGRGGLTRTLTDPGYR